MQTSPEDDERDRGREKRKCEDDDYGIQQFLLHFSMTPHVQHTPVARTKAQAIRDMVEIRLAVNEAGPAIAAVLKENGIELQGVKWDNVSPHWLIATVEDDVVGCCQVVVSKPVGYVEFLFVRPSLGFKVKAIAIRKLMIQSMAALRLAGCNYVGGFVSQKNGKFADVIKKINFAKAFSADLYVKRLK